MSRNTIKSALIDILEDLRESQLRKFCSKLLDRREEPRVRRRSVENKDVYDISDVLVSTFRESGALAVSTEILRDIGCNEEAERLDSRTKACLDTGNPIFRRNPKGELVMEATQEARNHVAGRRQQAGRPAKGPEEVEAEAEARVVSEGGDPGNNMLVLSRYTIQFGQYQGQTFKWLLENDVGYTAYLVASKGTASHLMANKDALTRYSRACPDFVKEVRFHRALGEAKVRSLPPGQEGQDLVGFGKYRSETLQSLYESKDKEKISYINFLRRQTSDPGTKMDIAIKYIRHRDQAETVDAAAATMAASSRSARKTTSRAPAQPPAWSHRQTARNQPAEYTLDDVHPHPPSWGERRQRWTPY
ncbi:uncharacterized protein [Centroberyx affinis]|uniref:uncharacterized protein n=1 Tax=Centroberyx affinis TaxID=166261 RepID=UPI003A5C3E92